MARLGRAKKARGRCVTDEPPKAPQKDGGNQDLFRYLGLGMQLSVTVAVFAGIGWWLDSKYGWSPYGLLSLGSLGVAAGLYHFAKDALR